MPTTSRTTAGRYNRVGSKKAPLAIGGAMKKMEEDPTFCYVPLFRVAGPQEEVEQWLKENHSDQMKEAMKGCYSQSNLSNKAVRAAFDEEIENARESRAAASSTKAEMRQVNLMVLVRLLSIYDEQRRSGNPEEAVATVKTTNDLKMRVKALESEGKVLDITTMKDNGSDAKKVTLKDGSTKRRLSQAKSDPFYNVVYNPKSKKSVEGVRNFLTAFGGFDEDRIEKTVSAVADGTILNISRGKSPTRSPILSPSRRNRDRKGRKEDIEDILDDL